jgi:hypothetical protein
MVRATLIYCIALVVGRGRNVAQSVSQSIAPAATVDIAKVGVQSGTPTSSNICLASSLQNDRARIAIRAVKAVRFHYNRGNTINVKFSLSQNCYGRDKRRLLLKEEGHADIRLGNARSPFFLLNCDIANHSLTRRA